MALNETAATKSIDRSVSTSVSTGENLGHDHDFGGSSLHSTGYDKDVLSQFRANLQQVEDLNLRLRFVLNEVNGLIKRV